MKKSTKYFGNSLKSLKIFFRDNLRYDIVAGITVALVMIPQSMAYAGLAGLPVYIGLYTAFFGVLLGALFGSSKQMSTGPVTIISIMTAAVLGSLGLQNPDQYMSYAALLAIFIGGFYAILYIARLSVIVEFLSHPVIIGFTNAIAIITIIAQLEKIFGIPLNSDVGFFAKLFELLGKIPSETHFFTLGFGLLGIIGLYIFRKINDKLPGVLLVLVISTFVSYFFGFADIHNGKIVGFIAGGFPEFGFAFSHLDSNIILRLIPFAAIIGIIGFTESVAVSKAVALKTKQKLSINQELIGQAAANIGSGLFGGYGVAGSFSRTAVNLRAGAKTKFASIITGTLIGITLMYLTELLYFIPKATLSAIIIVAVAGLIRFEPIWEAWKIQKKDAIVALITFTLTIILTPKVEIAILCGVILSLMFYIFRSMRPKLIELSLHKDGILRDSKFFKLKTSKHLSILKVDGSLFFANIGFFEKQVVDSLAEKKKLKIVVFDFEWMNNIDSSAFVGFKDMIFRLQKSGIDVYVCNLRVKVLYKMNQVGFLEKLGKRWIFSELEDVIIYLKENYSKEEIDLGPILEYEPRTKKSEKIAKEVFEKISGVE